MGWGSLYKQESQTILPMATQLPAGLTDIVSSSFEAARRTGQTFSEEINLYEAYNTRASKFKELTGEDLPQNPAGGLKAALDTEYSQALLEQQNRAIAEAADRYPDNKDNILALLSYDANAEAQRLAKQSLDNLRGDLQSNQSLSAYAASFVGGIGAAFTDPINIGATIATGGAGITNTLLRTMAREAAVNVGVEALQLGDIAAWQRELGETVTGSDLLYNMALAGAAGAGFPAMFSGIRQGAKLGKSLTYSIAQRASQNPSLSPEFTKNLAAVARGVHVEKAVPSYSPTATDVIEHYKSMDSAYKAAQAGRHADIEITNNADAAVRASQIISAKTPVTPEGSELYAAVRPLDGDIHNPIEAITGVTADIDLQVATELKKRAGNTVAIPITSRGKVRTFGSEADAKKALSGVDGFVRKAGDGWQAYSVSNADVLRSPDGNIRTFDNRGAAVAAAKGNGVPVKLPNENRYYVVNGINDKAAKAIEANPNSVAFNNPAIPSRSPENFGESSLDNLADEGFFFPKAQAPQDFIETARSRIDNAEIDKAMEAEFSRFNDDDFITFDDGTVRTIADIRNDFISEDNYLRAVTVCGIG